MFAIVSIPSSENSRSTFSVFNKATYCLIKLKSGSLKIRLKSSLVNASSSTLMVDVLEALEEDQMVLQAEMLQMQ